MNPQSCHTNPLLNVCEKSRRTKCNNHLIHRNRSALCFCFHFSTKQTICNKNVTKNVTFLLQMMLKGIVPQQKTDEAECFVREGPGTGQPNRLLVL